MSKSELVSLINKKNELLSQSFANVDEAQIMIQDMHKMNDVSIKALDTADSKI